MNITQVINNAIKANLQTQEIVKNHPTMSAELKAFNLARLNANLAKLREQLA